MFDVAPHQRTRKSTYEQWLADDGLPLVQGHYIADLKTAPLEPWARRNAFGSITNHDASNTSNDCSICSSWGQPRRRLHNMACLRR